MVIYTNALFHEKFPTKIEIFLDAAKKQQNGSPLPSPEERHSIYDNVPLIICNKSYHDYQPDLMDSGMLILI